jgi:hypothetical protein
MHALVNSRVAAVLYSSVSASQQQVDELLNYDTVLHNIC